MLWILFSDTRKEGSSLLLVLKWGGELTPAGRVQAEELGRAFRCMYPGGQGEMHSGDSYSQKHHVVHHCFSFNEKTPQWHLPHQGHIRIHFVMKTGEHTLSFGRKLC